MKLQPPKPIDTHSSSAVDDRDKHWRESGELQNLLDLMVDFYWETDRNHRVRKFLDGEGKNLAHLQGAPFWELCGLPAFEAGSWERLIGFFDQREVFKDFLLKQPFPGQGLKFINLSGRPVFSERGEFLGYKGIARDISDYALSLLVLNSERRIRVRLEQLEHLEVACNFILKLVCDSFLWSQGRYWSYDPSQQTLTRHGDYRLEQHSYMEIDDASVELHGLKNTSSPLSFAVENQTHVWGPAEKPDDTGHRTTFVFPIVYRGQLKGVFEFLSDTQLPEDGRVVTLFQHTAKALSEFIEKQTHSEKLDTSESRVNYFIHHTPSWYWEVDKEGRYTYFSGKAVDLNPELFDSFLGKRPWENDIELVEEWDNLQSIFRTQASFENHIFKAHFKTGKVLDLRFSGDPIFDSDGNFSGYRGVAQDITKRKQTEKNLEDTKTHLEVILRSTEAGLYRLRFIPGSKEIRIAAWDENFARLYGCPDPEKATEHELIKRVHPDDVITATDDIWKSIDQGLSEHQNEYRILLDDGSVRWLFTSAKFHFDEESNPESITGVVIDITERKEIEQSLEETQEQLRTALYTTNIGLFKQVFDPGTSQVFNKITPLEWNFNMAPLFGYTGEDSDTKGITTGTFYSSVHPDDLEQAKRMIDEVVKNKETDHQNEFRVIWPDGSIRWLYTRTTISYSEDGKPKDMIGIAVDITDRKEAERKIQYLATHDGLTGLTNRNVFNQMIEHEIHVARRSKSKFAVMFIDLDRFKMINDSLGHDAGDQLLKTMSQRLQSAVRDGDIISRLGGDEFVILAREISSDHQAANLAQKILYTVSEPILLSNREYRVTASIGVASYPEDGEDELSLMKNADVAMYLAKEEGKNNFQFYSASIKTLSLEKLTLENDLRKALTNNEFYLEYQAKMHTKDGSVSGVEALVRWKHPDLGLVSPDDFIPLAEETGLIIPIGRWVLEHACRQAKAWQEQGLPPTCIAVNLSPRQFSDPHLLQDVAEVLDLTKLQPDLLELEITESMVMNNADRAVTLLKSIKSLGVRLAIDDFGTGYSSLGQLKQFPIDTLKVDKSFIQHIPEDKEDRAITEAIIAMGKSLSLTVIAEGVENSEQQRFLTQHACDQMQGFYFSRPVSAEQLTSFLQSQISDR